MVVAGVKDHSAIPVGDPERSRKVAGDQVPRSVSALVRVNWSQALEGARRRGGVPQPRRLKQLPSLRTRAGR